MFNNNIKYTVSIFIVIALIIWIFISLNTIQSLRKDNEITYANLKAYSDENSLLKKDSRVFQLTINQLENYNDSVFQEMNKIKDKLKIKDKELTRVEYINQTSIKIDTIYFKDTIFKENFSFDTVISDPWYSLSLSLKYPSKITIQPEFKNELFIFTSDKRETIKPPNKFFLFKWFQKKHTIRTVEIYDKSPYNKINNKKFVEIIK